MESSWSYGLEGGFWVSDELPVETLKRATNNPLTERNIIPFCEGEFMESDGVTDIIMWNSLVSSSSANREDDDVIKILSPQSVKLPSHGESNTPQSKRAKTTTNYEEMKTYTQGNSNVINFGSQVPVCQVHGCKRDLSSSKHYHRKHKVCGEHSMAAQVVVNGTEQRFCQQCSRFHMVAEFDGQKKSCRKRLAEHNERRRKPLNQIHWGPAPRFLDMGSQRLAMPFAFHFPEDLSQTYFCHEIYGKNSSCQIDLRENPIFLSEFTPKQVSMKTSSATGGKSRRATFSLLSAEPTSGKPSGKITSNSFKFLDCNEADQTEGNNQECGPILDLQQLSALLQRVQQQQELASF